MSHEKTSKTKLDQYLEDRNRHARRVAGVLDAWADGAVGRRSVESALIGFGQAITTDKAGSSFQHGRLTVWRQRGHR